MAEPPELPEFAGREAKFRQDAERRDEAEQEVDRWFAELKRRDDRKSRK